MLREESEKHITSIILLLEEDEGGNREEEGEMTNLARVGLNIF